jgi:hypothetical protein
MTEEEKAKRLRLQRREAVRRCKTKKKQLAAFMPTLEKLLEELVITGPMDPELEL